MSGLRGSLEPQSGCCGKIQSSGHSQLSPREGTHDTATGLQKVGRALPSGVPRKASGRKCEQKT